MSKDNIAQQYNNMVASIEDAKIYDGRGEYTNRPPLSNIFCTSFIAWCAWA